MILERMPIGELRKLANLFDTLNAQLARGRGSVHSWNAALQRLCTAFHVGCAIRDAVDNGKARRDWTTAPKPPDGSED